MKRYALVIGISKYADPEITDLSFAAHDAEEVGTCLRETCGFDEVRTLASGGSREPDHVNVVDALHSLAPLLLPEDLFLLYFAGHGIETKTGAHLLTSNSRIHMPELASVSTEILSDCLSRIECADRVLILDACRNDPHKGMGDEDNLMTSGFSRDVLAVAETPVEGVVPTTAVLFSCRLNERAYEWPDKKHGAFTHYLLEGLRGSAADDSGRVTVQSLGRYVEVHVPRWAKKTGTPRPQTPWGEQKGSWREIFLATGTVTTPRPRTKPASSPKPVSPPKKPQATQSKPTAQWWVVIDGQEQGPLDDAGIREAIKQGQVTRKTECWRNGMDAWRPIGETTEWADAFPPIRKAPLAAKPPKRKPSISLPEFLEPVADPEHARLGGLSAGSEAAQKRQMQWVEKGYPLEVVMKKTEIVFRLLSPGEFLMGSKGDSEAFDDEKPQHKVNIASALYVAKFPVTQQQWQAVMDENPAKFQTGMVLAKGGIFKQNKRLETDTKNHPVECVSWNNCQAYLNRVHDQLDLEIGKAIRLPTEAEWEYACRAGTTDSRYGNLDTIGWFDGNSGGMMHPVGKKRPNAWGLHDMIGNVWEWCEDGWHDGYKNAPVDGSAWMGGELARVLRGGGWGTDSRFCRSSYRNWIGPVYRYDYVGFRVVVDLE